MKHLFCCILLMFFAFCKADITLVKSGKPKAKIVLASLTKSARLGVLELQHHIELITGVRLPIVSSQAEGNLYPVLSVMEKDKIYIFVGGENKVLNGETARIRFDKNIIRLTGSDSPVYTKVNYADEKTFPSYRYQFNGSLWAVYEFLERYCGVRFYGIGEEYTAYQPRKTLTVKEKNWQHTPTMDLFRDIFLHTRTKSKRDVALWRLRWRLAEFTPPANHNMYSMYFRFHGRAKSRFLAPLFQERRPEYFARGFKLTGSADPRLKNNYPGDKTLSPQLCYTSEGVKNWYVNEVLTYAGGKNLKGGFGNKDGTIEDTSRTMIPRMPGRKFFYPIEGGDNGHFCLCSTCKPFTRDKNNFSHLKFNLMSRIAREVAKKDPDAGVSTLAYIQSMYYPDNVKLADNMMIQICLTIYSWWHPTAYKLQHGEYKKWIAKEGKKRPLTIWTYLFGSPWDAKIHFGKYHPFPTFYPEKTGELFKEFASDGIRGWFCEVQLEHHLLEAYIASRICYDSSVNVDQIIDEYFAFSYGPAGKMIKEFYKESETAFWNPANCPAAWLKDPNVFVGPYGKKHPFWGTGLISPDLNWGIMGNPQRMAKMKKLIAEAQKQKLTPAQQKRLNIFLKDIWGTALRGEAEFARNRNSQSREKSPAVYTIKKSVNGDPEKIDWSQFKPFRMTSADGTKNVSDKFYLAADQKYLYIRYETSEDLGGQAQVVFAFSSPDGKVNRFMSFSQTPGTPYSTKVPEPSNYRSKKTPSGWVATGAISKKYLPFQNGAVKANVIRRVPEEAEKPVQIAVWQPTWYGDDLYSAKYHGYLTFLPSVVQEKDFVFNGKALPVDDPAAVDGRAGKMDASQGWTMRYHVPDQLCGKRKVTIFFRTDITDPNGKFSLGIYDKFNRKNIYSRQIRAADYSGKNYKAIILDGVNLIPGSYIYFGSLQPKTELGKHHYYVDFIIFE